jgi:hypothetical protein
MEKVVINQKNYNSNMAAKDYVFVAGMVTPYLAKKTKGPVMSQDRRTIEDNEIFGLFEFFLRKFHSETRKDSVTIVNSDGKKIFEATLLDKK